MPKRILRINKSLPNAKTLPNSGGILVPAAIGAGALATAGFFNWFNKNQEKKAREQRQQEIQNHPFTQTMNQLEEQSTLFTPRQNQTDTVTRYDLTDAGQQYYGDNTKARDQGANEYRALQDRANNELMQLEKQEAENAMVGREWPNNQEALASTVNETIPPEPTPIPQSDINWTLFTLDPNSEDFLSRTKRVKELVSNPNYTWDPREAFAIALAETNGGAPDMLINRQGSTAAGLMQVLSSHGSPLEFEGTEEEFRQKLIDDWEYNVQLAHDGFKNKDNEQVLMYVQDGWNPWATYNNPKYKEALRAHDILFSSSTVPNQGGGKGGVIKDAVNWVSNNVLKPSADGYRSLGNTIQEAFGPTVSNVQDATDRVNTQLSESEKYVQNNNGNYVLTEEGKQRASRNGETNEALANAWGSQQQQLLQQQQNLDTAQYALNEANAKLEEAENTKKQTGDNFWTLGNVLHGAVFGEFSPEGVEAHGENEKAKQNLQQAKQEVGENNTNLRNTITDFNEVANDTVAPYRSSIPGAQQVSNAYGVGIPVVSPEPAQENPTEVLASTVETPQTTVTLEEKPPETTTMQQTNRMENPEFANTGEYPQTTYDAFDIIFKNEGNWASVNPDDRGVGASVGPIQANRGKLYNLLGYMSTSLGEQLPQGLRDLASPTGRQAVLNGSIKGDTVLSDGRTFYDEYTTLLDSNPQAINAVSNWSLQQVNNLVQEGQSLGVNDRNAQINYADFANQRGENGARADLVRYVAQNYAPELVPILNNLAKNYTAGLNGVPPAKLQEIIAPYSNAFNMVTNEDINNLRVRAGKDYAGDRMQRVQTALNQGQGKEKNPVKEVDKIVKATLEQTSYTPQAQKVIDTVTTNYFDPNRTYESAKNASAFNVREPSINYNAYTNPKKMANIIAINKDYLNWWDNVNNVRHELIHANDISENIKYNERAKVNGYPTLSYPELGMGAVNSAGFGEKLKEYDPYAHEIITKHLEESDYPFENDKYPDTEYLAYYGSMYPLDRLQELMPAPLYKEYEKIYGEYKDPQKSYGFEYQAPENWGQGKIKNAGATVTEQVPKTRTVTKYRTVEDKDEDGTVIGTHEEPYTEDETYYETVTREVPDEPAVAPTTTPEPKTDDSLQVSNNETIKEEQVKEEPFPYQVQPENTTEVLNTFKTSTTSANPRLLNDNPNLIVVDSNNPEVVRDQTQFLSQASQQNLVDPELGVITPEQREMIDSGNRTQAIADTNPTGELTQFQRGRGIAGNNIISYGFNDPAYQEHEGVDIVDSNESGAIGNQPVYLPPNEGGYELATDSQYGENTNIGTVNVNTYGTRNPYSAESNLGFGNTVQFRDRDTGNIIRVEHLAPNTLQTFSEGEVYPGGTLVANVGNTGNSSSDHLHFDVRDANGNFIDPTDTRYANWFVENPTTATGNIDTRRQTINNDPNAPQVVTPLTQEQIDEATMSGRPQLRPRGYLPLAQDTTIPLAPEETIPLASSSPTPLSVSTAPIQTTSFPSQITNYSTQNTSLPVQTTTLPSSTVTPPQTTIPLNNSYLNGRSGYINPTPQPTRSIPQIPNSPSATRANDLDNRTISVTPEQINNARQATNLNEYANAIGINLNNWRDRASLYQQITGDSATNYSGDNNQNAEILNYLKANLTNFRENAGAGWQKKISDFIDGYNKHTGQGEPTNLWEYYQHNLPQIKERSKIYEEKGLGSASEYKGYYNQNMDLLNELKHPQTIQVVEENQTLIPVLNTNGFLSALGQRESGNNYQAKNSLGYIGKYQFGEQALADIGAYKTNDFNNNWNGQWQIEGVNSLDDFLNSPEAQEQAQRKLMQKNWQYIQNLGLDKYIGKKINGITITPAALLAASHLGGVGSVKKLLTTGNANKDAYGTSVLSYMEQFGNYDVNDLLGQN